MDYRIKSGDTLSQIAKTHHTSVSALMKANPKLKDANVIQAGKSLNIPGKTDGFDDKPSRAMGSRSSAKSDAKNTTSGADAASSGGAKGAKGNPLDIAKKHLNKNAGSLKLEKKGVGADMDDNVGNKVNCANFVSACLEQAGQIKDSQHSNLVRGLQNNLDKDKNFKRVSLKDAKPGDVVSLKTGSGVDDRHVVIFAGWKNGKAEFIGSNNRNPDRTQRITMTMSNAPVLSVHHYTG
ncbi:LysM peptidoglycan-binding domain-containing protein [Corallococcus silvisoli]|uniref:LysM peptidoglycan-binding domain-containing protein n=1 Tax=Corallococcus silvisoli TaxID=2697031 RepID=UPI001378849A|nr:LysM domain-containing protein [Corallococcus silvisoli]NBD12337.1 LysM peptidoglycan-binding domain-containing protein [Corallococcus silvisoli]